ncbi:type VI secretion system ATPase TssH [Massilia endophytica]|uniref:type VI secretion system ATPase TssH n=1 Tax=Massilia endophytica TaxID=2899220 RepID=UPI001E4768FB|nr:type VI secretion system ATPase TssH [Massilia endophytica]UGQ44826.1 type VI secretion system ATPase TssH [Massilia endophytica]
MSANLKTLIEKLNDTCRAAASRAANLCMAMGHHEVEVEHLFVALLEQERSDVPLVARRCGVSLELLDSGLRAELQKLRAGSSRVPVFSRHLAALLEHAWLIASLNGGQFRVRSGHLLLALLTEPDLAQLAERSSPQFGRFPVDELKHRMQRYTEGSIEDSYVENVDSPDMPAATPALDQYTTDMTRMAKEGKLDPVIGRDVEVRQVIDILMRRRQNNPILTGEAGVGKTAVAEGLALRIAAGEVPEVLRNVAIHALDMAQLQAGASVKGEFEHRLKNVIAEVGRSVHPIVLFIDEAHMLIGAGGAAGQNDAANLLKPALARGELRTIAATTWSEYKKYFEKDAALARRFQVVKVEEPDETAACAMLRAMAPLMERHFGIRVRGEAIGEAVRLSRRYISGRQLPDKAVSVLDTACARVALGQTMQPAELERLARQAEAVDAELAMRERDAQEGHGDSGVAAQLREQLQETRAAQARVAARWQREKSMADEIRRLRSAGPPGELLPDLEKELKQLQGDSPLVPLEVDGATVAQVVSAWTGIPLGKMLNDDIEAVRRLENQLGKRIRGQAHALAAIARRVRTSRAGLEDPGKPKAAFLFAGPSGVGKTATALALAELLYGGERKLVTINMSEYQEAHSVAGLKGSPPGYVGYGEGGVLTEAVRRDPYCVVLLDEIDKAHGDVTALLFQVLDKGVLEDGEGQPVDFRNAIIIATCNTGSAAVMQACLNKPESEQPLPEQLAEAIRPQLAKQFRPAFLGRLQVIPYYPVSDGVLAEIVELKLQAVADRMLAAHQAEFSWDEALAEAVLARCTEVDSGARNVDNIVGGSLLPELADIVLARMAEGVPVSKIAASASESGGFLFKAE